MVEPLSNSAASTPDDLADSSGYLWSRDALHFAGFNVSHAPPCFGLPAFLDSRTEMKSFRQPVHQLHDLLRGQVPGLFDNLIQRHRHVLKLPTTQPQLKSEARVLPTPASWQMTCSVACATSSAGRLKSHRSLKPGSWSRPISQPHGSPKLTLMAFGAGHGSATLLPKHERPQGGRFHVSLVATS